MGNPVYVPGENMDVMIVDSGTEQIVIPPPVLEALKINPSDLKEDTELTITAGTASLTFSIADVMIDGQAFIGPPKGATYPQAVIGWPAFLTFDVQFTATPD